MQNRHQARMAALQALYQCEVLDNWNKDCVELFFKTFYSENAAELSEIRFLIDQETKNYALEIVSAVGSNLQSFNIQIQNSLRGWTLQRIAAIDRAILRLALAEKEISSDLNSSIIIDEAVNLAHEFGTDNSPAFINGVLENLLNSVEDFSESTANTKMKSY